MQYSIVKLSEVKRDNDFFRLDAEFFRKKLLKLEKEIVGKQWNYLGNVCESIVNFGAYSLCNQINFLEEGVPYLNVGNIGKGFIDYDNSPKIDKKLSKTVLWKSLVENNQVLLTIAGTIGNAAVANNPPDYCNSNQAIANIRTSSDISPYFLAIFLNSKHGRGQSERLTISSVQPNLLLTQVKNLKIYIPSSYFQNIIENKYKLSLADKESSLSLMTEAQNILLSELGLTNWKPKHQLSFVRKFSDTEDAGRMDAEYLQPKYDEVIERFQKKNGTPLQKIAALTKGNQARCETGTIPYASIKDIHNNVIESEEFAEDSNQLVLVDKDDLALAITGATTGKIGVNIKKEKIAICGDLLRIHAKDISPYYLLAFLGLPLVTDLFKRSVTGMTNGHLSPEIVKEIPVPILEENVIEQIDNGIKKAFSLREQSKHLLECAKLAVEIAIEQDEQTAIEWLERETA